MLRWAGQPAKPQAAAEFIFNADGTVSTPWWSKEIAVLICALCGVGGGISRFGTLAPSEAFVPSEELGSCRCCPVRDPYCG
jgi:hypothetical protein